GHKNIELAHGSFALRYQRLDLLLVREVARQHVDAVLKLAGELIERVAARTGERDGRALLVKRARDRPPDPAGRSGDKRGPAGQIEHRSLPDSMRWSARTSRRRPAFRSKRRAPRRRSACRDRSAPCRRRPRKTW